MKDDTALYKVTRPIITFLFRVLYRPTYIGLENIGDGPVILAGNHTSNLDPLLMISSTKRSLHFLTKIELFRGPKKIIFGNMGLIPVDRQNKTTHPLKEAEEYLKIGSAIIIFPEGTIGRGKLLDFKYGAVKLASVTNTKITPFVIKNKYKLFRKKITVEFLKPISISNDLESENKKLRSMIKDSLEAI